mmetsp:Transcript_15837/g.22229  ORF Transcript_15837/g.22229 Transcript_15837/m.22229 type:complete len:97 (-) Transcript_15837:248-538(-)
MVKPLLPRNVQNKIQLLSEDPKQTLLKLIPDEKIPSFFGGIEEHKDHMVLEEKSKSLKFCCFRMQEYQRKMLIDAIASLVVVTSIELSVSSVVEST